MNDKPDNDILQELATLTELYHHLNQGEHTKEAAEHIAKQITTLAKTISYEEING